jgi:glycosyltransferase involved in cell wall biosynthesis
METLVKSLPTWAEWVLVKSVKDGTNNEVIRAKNVVKAYYNYTGDFNFMNSKNYAKQFASGEWILWLDDDEHLDIFQHDYIKYLVDNVPDEVGGLYCTQYSWLEGHAEPGSSSNVRIAGATVRMCRNIPPVKWEHHIHDVLEKTIVKSGYKILDTNIRILHDGWAIPKDKLAERLERNIKAIWKHPELMDAETYDRYFSYLIETSVAYKYLKTNKQLGEK